MTPRTASSAAACLRRNRREESRLRELLRPMRRYVLRWGAMRKFREDEPRATWRGIYFVAARHLPASMRSTRRTIDCVAFTKANAERLEVTNTWVRSLHTILRDEP